MLNVLGAAIDSGKGNASCAKVLDDIIGHAKTHFEFEERLMTQHQYPKAEQHAGEHAMLISQALNYRDSFDRDSAAARSALTDFPEVWLAFHILFSDKELAAFLARDQAGPGKT